MNKKLRNRLLALGCLIVFLALGAAFYVNWVVQKPFAIILFLTDNLTPSVLTPARMFEGGADHRLHMERMPHLALVTTHANDFAVPDTASAAATIATGRKINNRSLGVDAGGTPIPTLLELAQSRGRATGLVSNTSLTDATPAAFYAKLPDPLDYERIGLALTESNVNVLLGGGSADLLPESKEGRRQDGRDLLLEMRNRGYDIVRNRSELANSPAWRAPKVLGVFSAGNLPFEGEMAAAGSLPSLADMVRQAILFLQYNAKGYFLVVDAGLGGKAAVQNEGERVLREMLALDRAVATALEYAGENALIIVAGKQSVSGLRLNGFPFRNDKGTGLLGVNVQGVPSITWSTGPGYGETGGSEAPAPAEPAAVRTNAGIGVAEDSIVLSSGPGAETFTGFQDNTGIYRLIEKGM
ncbi:MAG: alkaline phosphatase [Terrimicrobiaceae bacterium]|nr:alkaline phosphatase [Terrimicrobiaceae bacterium]